MTGPLTLGEITLDPKRDDPRFTWIEMLNTGGEVAGHVLVETAAIEALGSFEDAKGDIMRALEARVAERGYDAVAQEISTEGLQLVW